MVEIAPGDLVETLRRCNGYYQCPKAPDGKRLGPLVGYAGEYDAPDGTRKHWVGDVYYNFARIEEYPHVLRFVASQLAGVVRANGGLGGVDYVMGAPVGGFAIALMLAWHLDCRYVFPEKKVTAAATVSAREQSVLVFGRHEVEPGKQVLVAEDVCNNFSTTEKVRELVQAAGSRVVGIACELNRSARTTWEWLPVCSILHLPTEQYQQDDPAVAADIAA
ncbi:MAG: hypothetical protein HYS45_01950, partial [Parcubacteria group bacterium]|nr:hypothetical protein [Parcubacteria group bacterium]